MFASNVSNVSNVVKSRVRLRVRWRSLVGLIAAFSIASAGSLAAMNAGTDQAEEASGSVVEVETEKVTEATEIEEVTQVEEVTEVVKVEQVEEFDWELVGLSVFDAVVLRPVGVVATLGGFALFVVSVPFVAPAGRIATAWDIFVYASYDDTFVRPLGEI
ncbi:MAG: hypothetical protein IH881_04160 [Myxococcales bacterium]|nr:hypothetical protein [Myxococcales bacterium]